VSKSRAVVMGGSVAGVMAGMAAAEFFDEVVVVERDELEFGADPRKGVPQGKQAHALLAIGMTLSREFIPDLPDQLLAEGCCMYDQLRDVPMMTSQGWRVRAESTVKTVGFRRPLFESVVRRNLLERSNCSVVTGSIGGLIASEDNSRVTGVLLDDGRTVSGDLVIDATGRGSQSPKWIEELGYERPEEMHVRCFMGYGTRLVKVPDGVLEPEMAGVVAMPSPGHHRGGVLVKADNDLWIFTAAGMVRNYPPRESDGWYDFLDEAPAPVLGEIARACEPVTEVATYHMPGNQRRLWEELDRRPRGLIVTGDAVASYNPIYGQGLAQAAKGGVVLRDCLADPDGDLETLHERFQAGHGEFTAEAFGVSAMADTFYEGGELENVERPDPDDYAYATALEQLATEDAEVLVRVATAQFSMRSEDLEAEDLKAKAQAWIESGRQVTNKDGSTLPPVVEIPAAAG
jgi:2-polyprenyl-6-methoxyphenol hydroxylase-like FAD-dependent oxidoreductase